MDDTGGVEKYPMRTRLLIIVGGALAIDAMILIPVVWWLTSH